jgi:hypothetical protein
MVRTAFVVFALLLASSAPVLAAPPVEALVSIPPVGEEAEAEVGMTMVSAVRVQQIPAIRTVASYEAKGVFVPAGPLSYSGHDANGTYYLAPGRRKMGGFLGGFQVSTGIYVYDDGRPSEVFWYDSFGSPVRYKAAGIAFSKLPPKPAPSAASFKRELVYSGVSGGVVRIAYREFSRDMARPAFTQELTYDLADGDEIGFRGARFRVLKATNVSIRYVVIKPLAGE